MLNLSILDNTFIDCELAFLFSNYTSNYEAFILKGNKMTVTDEFEAAGKQEQALGQFNFSSHQTLTFHDFTVESNEIDHGAVLSLQL